MSDDIGTGPQLARHTSLWSRVGERLAKLLDRYQPSESMILMITALVVGIAAGLGAVLFRTLIGAVTQLSFERLPEMIASQFSSSGWLVQHSYLVIAPVLGGLGAGWLITRYAREAKGHGVPEVMEAVALRGGRIRPIVPAIKSFASSLTIGTGGSVGSEGPIVQIGSGLGSFVGQVLHLSDDRIKSLVACGAAGGIAAVFNAPIAGVVFAVEIILGEFSVANLSPVVLSSVMASIVGRVAFGNEPAFTVPSYALRSLWEFPMYAVLGVLAAFLSVGYTVLVYWMEDRFERQKRIPEWVQPAVGGLLLGVMALLYGQIPALSYDAIPQVFGVGYETIGATLLGFGAIPVMLALMILKLLATAFTLGSGGSGGVFAPALFVGAMLGGSFGIAMNQLFPNITAPAGAYAVVGMSAVFAGSTHAAITAVIMLFELTGDYRVILPMMLAVIITTLLARYLLHGESIYTLKLSRRGVRLSSGRDIDVMEGVTVEEAMTRQVDTVPATMTLTELSNEFRRTQHHGFPVLDEEGKLFGVATVQDLKRALERHVSPNAPVRDIAITNVVVAYPDEPMALALHRLSVRGVGRLPVVAREDPTRLLGAVRRSDIVRAYNIALTRRAEVQHRAAHMRLRRVDRAEFVEVVVGMDAPCVNCTVQYLAKRFPHESVLVSIRRANGQVIIPHGDTIFLPGDRVTVFVETEAEEKVRQLLAGYGAT